MVRMVSRSRWDGDLVVEHVAARAAARTGWLAEGQHVHDLGGAARRGVTWQRTGPGETGAAIRKRKRGEVKVHDPDASAKKA